MADSRLDAAYAHYRSRYEAERGEPDPELTPAGLGTLVLDTIDALSRSEIGRVGRTHFRGDLDAAADAVAAGDARAARSVPPVFQRDAVARWLKLIHDNAAKDIARRESRRHVHESAAATEAALLDDFHTAGVTGSGIDRPAPFPVAANDQSDLLPEDGEETMRRGERGFTFLAESRDDSPRREVAVTVTPEDEVSGLQQAEALSATLSAAPEAAETIEAAAMGDTTREIAAARGVSVSTVERERRQARELAQAWKPADRRAPPDSDAERERIANALKPAWRLRAGVNGPLGLPPPKRQTLAKFLMHSALHLVGGGFSQPAPASCLSDAELVEVTGKQRPAAQARVLNHLGITHRRRPDGSVLVHRAHFDRLLDAAANGRSAPREAEPNWDDPPRATVKQQEGNADAT